MANLVAMLRLPSNLKSTQWQILAGPVLIMLILSMMVLPLPAFVLDLLFTFNIALSIMVLLVAMFTQRTGIRRVPDHPAVHDLATPGAERCLDPYHPDGRAYRFRRGWAGGSIRPLPRWR